MTTVQEPAPGRRVAAGRAATVAAVVIAVDQIVKHTVATSIGPYETRHVIGSVVELVHVRNSGVAFGILSGGGAIVYAVTALALIALVGYLLTRPGRRLLWLPTGMLAGGAVSNLIDRIARGSVIDFIKLPHWPAFNLADASITVGVVILVVIIEAGTRTAGDRA